MSEIYLVSCVGKKLIGSAKAKDLYISHWFKAARRYVESLNARWFILSAHYGLLAPDSIVSTYEVTLNTMPVAQRKRWAADVFTDINRLRYEVNKVVMLAGMRYREFLTPLLERRGVRLEVPMRGLGIGKQLQWFKKNTPSEPLCH